jgi:hypothetical protein
VPQWWILWIDPKLAGIAISVKNLPVLKKNNLLVVHGPLMGE